MQLTSGCLCCNIKTDLICTLQELVHRRATGEMPSFDRVIIETTGLAEPAPILHAIMTDPTIRESYTVDNLIVTVDAVLGLDTIQEHDLSRRQIAFADALVVTKTDLSEDRGRELTTKLRQLNSHALLHEIVRGEVAEDETLIALLTRRVRDSEIRAWAAIEHPAEPPPHHHDSEIVSYVIARQSPFKAAALTLFLQALAENCGAKLLRVKGLVAVSDVPGRPAVVHGVQHIFHPLEWLECWPSSDQTTRIVFIVEGVSPSWVRALLDQLEAEVEQFELSSTYGESNGTIGAG